MPDIGRAEELEQPLTVNAVCDVQDVEAVLDRDQEALAVLRRASDEGDPRRHRGGADRTEAGVVDRERHRAPDGRQRLGRLHEERIERDDAVEIRRVERRGSARAAPGGRDGTCRCPRGNGSVRNPSTGTRSDENRPGGTISGRNTTTASGAYPTTEASICSASAPARKSTKRGAIWLRRRRQRGDPEVAFPGRRRPRGRAPRPADADRRHWPSAPVAAAAEAVSAAPMKRRSEPRTPVR